ncbi:glycosyl hydrolase family 18 protein [Fangia hongkongensis]|uniref:glycosyl hydrolase family 18 protein n=1 Tax=Fangia hongkongensis TaxID=270495 RepID=UPI00039C2F82|nr:glycosyl hydrolase family 18 protein [Fangia hongkongensis]
MNKIIAAISMILLSSIACATEFPNKALVGYQENLNYAGEGGKYTAKYDTLLQKGYNVLIVAFAQLQGSKVSWYSNGWNNDGYAPYESKQSYLQAVEQYHAGGGIILASFGSDAGSALWNPDRQNPVQVADNITNFLIDNNLDGLDLDLEADQYANPSYLAKMLERLRKNANNNQDKFPHGFYITAAPIYREGYSHQGMPDGLSWAPGTIEGKGQGFNDLAQKTDETGQPLLDAIFVQNYNYRPAVPANVVFNKLINKKYVNYPEKTKFIMAYPAVEKASPHGGYVDPEVATGSLKQIVNNKRFAGVGVWDINYDIGSRWFFSDIMEEMLKAS